MIIELHIVQNFAPSCLNRDDLNAPKECEFGGVRRARISSQSLKRAARIHPDFAAGLADGIGTRTRLITKELVDFLIARGRSAEDAAKVVEPVVVALGAEVVEGRTRVALYLGHNEISRIGSAIDARYDEILAAAGEAEPEPVEEKPAKGAKPAKKPKKGSGSANTKAIADALAKQFTPGTKAADIALFGRMIAEARHFNVDAAAQVAHALSTHEVSSEFDFFTAVDDLQKKGDAGAGMMGTQQFNSATFYRYANVHMQQLVDNLGGDAALARSAAAAFVRAFITSIPGAKQNSHAAFNPPDLVLAVVRSNGAALSLANAFVRPVRARKDKGLLGATGDALTDYWTRLSTAYGAEGIVAAPYYSVPAELDSAKFDGGARVKGLAALLADVSKAAESWKPAVRK